MNDAGLAFGATSADIDNAIRQLSQLSMDGPLDAQTWNSLMDNGFGPVMAKMAEQAGITVGELKKQFGGNGTRTVGEFIEMLEKMDTEGTDSMDSLASVARKNTGGIATAIKNLQTRIQKAIGEIIKGIGEENIANIINGISSAIVVEGAVDNYPLLCFGVEGKVFGEVGVAIEVAVEVGEEKFAGHGNIILWVGGW